MWEPSVPGQLLYPVQTVGFSCHCKLPVQTAYTNCLCNYLLVQAGGAKCWCELPVQSPSLTLLLQFAGANWKNIRWYFIIYFFLYPLINYYHCVWTGAKVKCGLWTTIVNPRIYDGIFYNRKFSINVGKFWHKYATTYFRAFYRMKPGEVFNIFFF